MLTRREGIMSQVENSGTLERLQLAQPLLWAVAILFFGVGDAITTTLGLGMNGIYEMGPISSTLLDRYGLLSMPVVKIAIFGWFYVVWKLTPRPYRVGVPLGLSIVGVLVVWWNLLVQLLALRL